MSALIAMRCPVCDGQSFVGSFEAYDDRYGEPNAYTVATCQDCGHLATAPRYQESDLGALYGTYYPRRNITADEVKREAMTITAPFAKILRWLNGTDNQGQYAVRPGEKVLDVGCGSGVSLLEAQALGGLAYGIEADPNVKPIADALGLKIHFGSLHDTPFPEERFDLVVMNQVIEHVPEPDLTLKLLRQRLVPGGRIVLVFPNIRSLGRRLTGLRWIHWHIPYHLHHYDLASITRMAERCGLTLVRHRTITPNVWTILQLRAYRSIVKRGEPNPVWAVAAPKTTDSPASGGMSMRRLALTGIIAAFAVVNRLVDAFGLGESLMVELRDSGTP